MKIKKISETTQVTDVGTHKKSSYFLQVKFKDYKTAKDNKDKVWSQVSQVVALPKSQIEVDESHLDKHTDRYSRPVTVSYGLKDTGGIKVDRNIVSNKIDELSSSVSSISGVEKVWSLLGK